MDNRDSDPLLSQPQLQAGIGEDGSLEERVRAYRAKGQQILSSRKKHFVIMSLVAIDVVALLANIFIKLIACEMHQDDDEPWLLVVLDVLEGIGLIISSIFMVELIACLFSFGPRHVSENQLALGQLLT